MAKARTNYFDTNGNIVNRSRRFAGICRKHQPKGDITEATKRWALGEEKQIQAKGAVAHAKKAEQEAARKAKGGATLLSSALALTGARSRGRGGKTRQAPRPDNKTPGSKLPKVYFKESGKGFTAQDSQGKRLGSITRNGDGSWTASPSDVSGSTGKLRVAKARLARAIHYSMA